MIPLVSIFIPVFNGEKYLSNTLDSLIAQTFSDFEIIIVDDGSTDSTNNIAKNYCIKDSRIKLITHEKNLGLSPARNTGVKSANPNTQFLMNHDSDDISLPTKLERLVEYLQSHKQVDAVGTFGIYFNDQGDILGNPPIEHDPNRIKKSFQKVNSMIISATLMRRSLIDNIAPFRKEYGGCDDYDFWARSLLHGYVLANLPEELHKIRIHPNSFSARKHREMEFATRRVRFNYILGNIKNQIWKRFS